jgi:hypothetical protein
LDNLYPILQSAPAVSTTIPTGLISLWSGSLGSIPTGYVLCDGTNSTPDLRDRFIIGAGSAYAVAATGGSADAILVTHTHTATVTDPGHSHVISNIRLPSGGVTGGSSNTPPAAPPDAPSTTTQSASTGISVSNASAGTSGTNANLPPYYALAYIMKT